MMTIPHDPQLAKELAVQIDACSFAIVKKYFRSPVSDIDQVVLVQGNYWLDAVAAFFVRPPKEDPEGQLHTLVQAGVIKYGVDDLRSVHPEFLDNAILLDTISDDQLCYVIYLPPAYLVKLSEENWR